MLFITLLDYLPRKADNDCLTELRWMYDRRSIDEARQDLAAWLKKWSGRYPKLCDWVQNKIHETFTFYRLPRQHHKNLKSTNMLERLNEELKRRTLVVRIFPNAAACLLLVRALAVETHENWFVSLPLFTALWSRVVKETVTGCSLQSRTRHKERGKRSPANL
jgi:transposase-like protein